MASASVQPFATVLSVSALIRAFTRASSVVWLKQAPSTQPNRRIPSPARFVDRCRRVDPARTDPATAGNRRGCAPATAAERAARRQLGQRSWGAPQVALRRAPPPRGNCQVADDRADVTSDQTAISEPPEKTDHF